MTTTVWPSRSCWWPASQRRGGAGHGLSRVRAANTALVAHAEHEVGGQVVAERPRVVLPDRLVHLRQREDRVAGEPRRRAQRERADQRVPGRPAGQRAVLDAPTDAGGPVHEVRRGPGPAVGRWPPRDEALQLLADLPRGGRLVPAHHAGRELPPPERILAAVSAVAPVQQEVHRGRADRAGHRTGGELTTDADTASIPHEKSLLVTFVVARSIPRRSEMVNDIDLMVAPRTHGRARGTPRSPPWCTQDAGQGDPSGSASSQGDRDLALDLAVSDASDGGGNLAQRIGAVDRRGDVSRLDELAQLAQVAAVLRRGQHAKPLAHER